MATMTKRLVFPSSFDSTRYTAADAADDHPNLAQAQAEAVTTLLLGRPLGLTNTYAFDSRTVLSLLHAALSARAAVRKECEKNPAALERIDAADPFLLRWYAPSKKEVDFFSCCAEQLTRLQRPRRFILSAWKKIDDNDGAREALAAALTAEEPRFPDSVKELDAAGADGGAGELRQSFDTMILLKEYCRGRIERDLPSGASHISLLAYLEDFEGLSDGELREVMNGKIDVDTVMHLRESIKKVDPADKGGRSWAHHQVADAGGDQAASAFLLQQRQLIDTLYNEVLADSVGSNHDLLSSVPRTVGNAGLEAVNAFALSLIRFSKQRRRQAAGADDTEVPESFVPTTNMSEVFVAASAEPDLPASPVQALLTAYWRLIADDDTWRPWRESCDYLENSLNRALQLQAVGRSDAQLDDAWHAHLDTLQNRLPHVTAYEGQLASVVELGGTDYCTLTSFRVEDHASSLAAGEYIDRYLRGVVR